MHILHKQGYKATGGQPAFAPPGARKAHERVAAGKHPKHAQGEAKVLDLCVSAKALAAFARQPAHTTQEPQPP